MTLAHERVAVPAADHLSLSAAWHYRWQAVLFTWLVCALGWAAVFAIPNQYESSARHVCGRRCRADAAAARPGGGYVHAGQLDMLQRTLLSRPNLDKLISKTNLELELTTGAADREQHDRPAGHGYPDHAADAQPVHHHTTATRSPRLAYDVVRTMLATFVESKTGDEPRRRSRTATKFLERPDRVLRAAVAGCGAASGRISGRATSTCCPADGGRAEQAGCSRMPGPCAILQGQLQDALARRETLTRELAITPHDGRDGNGRAGTRPLRRRGGGNQQRLRDAERKLLREMRLRYTDTNPDVIAHKGARRRALRSGKGLDDRPDVAARPPVQAARTVPRPTRSMSS